jgi:hypothetical protein
MPPHTFKALKAAAKPSGPAPKDDVTGSVKQTAKTLERNDEKPAVSPFQLAEVRARPARVEDALEEWAEVSLAARVHNAPSVSAPTVRFYRVGTRLKVIGREPGWIKVVDPSASKEGWIYEKYVTPKEGPDQKQAGLLQQSQRQAAADMPNNMNVSPPQPEPYARSYRPRHGWRWYRAYRPPNRIRVQGLPQLGSTWGHKKPSGKSSALAQLERWLTQLGKSGYGD